jgi:hypothetical protein
MARLVVNRDVLHKATALVAEATKWKPVEVAALPLVVLYYPLHGRGEMTERFVRVTEMNDTHVKGFQITSETDEGIGMPHTYRLDKVEGGMVYLLRLAKSTK